MTTTETIAAAYSALVDAEEELRVLRAALAAEDDTGMARRYRAAIVVAARAAAAAEAVVDEIDAIAAVVAL